MGRQSRQKRERREGAATLFREAMAEVEAEDREARLRKFRSLAAAVVGPATWRAAENASVALVMALLEPSPWPCLGCTGKGRHVVAWRPDRRCLMEELGQGARDVVCVFYPVCDGCGRHLADDRERLERRAIRELMGPRTIRTGFVGH